jgi:hypothetical protein
MLVVLMLNDDVLVALNFERSGKFQKTNYSYCCFACLFCHIDASCLDTLSMTASNE